MMYTIAFWYDTTTVLKCLLIGYEAKFFRRSKIEAES